MFTILSTGTDVNFTKLTPQEAKAILQANGFESFIGHTDTAVLVGNIIGLEVPLNRGSLKFAKGDGLIVAQYIGPRLPEGTTVLPAGARFEFIGVAIK